MLLTWLLLVQTLRLFPSFKLQTYQPNHIGKLRNYLQPLALTTADFKNGLTIELDRCPYRVTEFLHVKPGKGAAFVRTKLKNLSNGALQEKTFRAGETITAAEVSKTNMQYLYSQDNLHSFMNMETFEEYKIESKHIDNANLLINGLTCSVSVWNEDQIIDVSLPQHVEYTVKECPPNLKGNTVHGAQKPATLNSGATINVPMFIEHGDKIIVSTANKKYVRRA